MEEGDITFKVKVTSDVNFKKLVKYPVVDKDGNEVSETRIIKVVIMH